MATLTAAGSSLCEFVGPNPEADQRVWSESLGNWNVRGIAALSDQDAADPWDVVARIERIPVAAEIGLEPAGKISRGPRQWHANLAEIAGAISRRNVHAAAERDGKVRIVAADALALVEHFPRRHGRARMLVAECDMVVNEIADRLDPRPAGRRLLEQPPRNVGEPVGLAVAATKQIDQGVRRQFLNGVLRGLRNDDIGQAAIAHRPVGRQ